MPGKVLTSVLQDDVPATGTGTSGTFTTTYDLPKANYIEQIIVTARQSGGSAPTYVLNRITIVANGSANLFDMTGTEFAKYNRINFRRNPQASNGFDASGATLGGGSATGVIKFSRFLYDRDVILPAKIFRTLQIKINYTLGGTTAPSSNLTVQTEEYVSADDPRGKLLMKTTELEQKASASGIRDFDLPLGNLYRRFYLEIPGTAPTFATDFDVSVRINNGAEIPFATKAAKWIDYNSLAYDLEVNDTTLEVIDFDAVATLQDVRDSSLYNDMKVRIGSGTTATTANLVAEELIRLS